MNKSDNKKALAAFKRNLKTLPDLAFVWEILVDGEKAHGFEIIMSGSGWEHGSNWSVPSVKKTPRRLTNLLKDLTEASEVFVIAIFQVHPKDVDGGWLHHNSLSQDLPAQLYLRTGEEKWQVVEGPCLDVKEVRDTAVVLLEGIL
jgi:hypothetical protein